MAKGKPVAKGYERTIEKILQFFWQKISKHPPDRYFCTKKKWRLCRVDVSARQNARTHGFTTFLDMKLNISFPATAQQKVVEIEDERKLRALYDHRISHEVEGESLGDEFKGYVFRISGGNDKQGFAMKQGVLTASRVRLLFSKGACARSLRIVADFSLYVLPI